jgi:hypothetical protein
MPGTKTHTDFFGKMRVKKHRSDKPHLLATSMLGSGVLSKRNQAYSSPGSKSQQRGDLTVTRSNDRAKYPRKPSEVGVSLPLAREPGPLRGPVAPGAASQAFLGTPGLNQAGT